MTILSTRRAAFGAPIPEGDRILRVNHAGEHGAICIYTGQLLLARLTARSLLAELREFRQHERRHRDIFAAELRKRGRRRCRSYWLCGIGGFVLGAVTAAFGASAIRATTVAVESVVLRHLDAQMETLRDTDPAACVAIAAIVEEERMHHDASDTGVVAFWRRVLMPIVSTATEGVIWMGMKF
ncbi:demethoxyubiquinone hydroxylase family protein [Noviluteimonas gilva]|uniref:Demethoxyubiquinone hydroxylase family protein n=1 Tax=Noviluteimonas gilva TaxID=2682097 RepID=A0A7C9HMN9_9GAMM|nr:demethoxyubiquinone hydroxylase family protein [Lysobacter gilvus]MUV14675.1 demethoxyubiquinone hydroxylase family protein [Lysobacter gilvus]